ncbi:MAG: hypothetical protein KKA54_06450 [Proteobacteria bacterium]|nr:hypothetical protein [Pseudomonadota bacterium]MBU0966005.1 hypothetical protein [Pseudomonadota bacterium]
MMSSGRKFAMVLTVAGLVLMGAYPLHAREVVHYKLLVDSEDAQKCISCHYGQENDSKNSRCSKNCMIDPGSSHPVAKKYPPRGKEKEYIPLKELRKTGLIKLQDGTITCISCHDVANNIAYHTVVEDRGTQLCKLCHIR